MYPRLWSCPEASYRMHVARMRQICSAHVVRIQHDCRAHVVNMVRIKSVWGRYKVSIISLQAVPLHQRLKSRPVECGDCLLNLVARIQDTKRRCMAKVISSGDLRGTFGDFTFVKSRRYGDHIRAKRGTYKKAKLNESFKAQNKKLPGANLHGWWERVSYSVWARHRFFSCI